MSSQTAEVEVRQPVTVVEPLTGGTAVLQMRDMFAQLAACYLEMREYAEARDAASMAEALEKFEEQHNITNIEWPPRVEKDEWGTWLAGNTDTRKDT